MEKINKQQIYNFYNRKNKWLGIIDYKTLLVFVLYCFVSFKIIFFIPIEVIYKLYILIIVILPFIIFIVLNIQEESIVDKLINIFSFFSKRTTYINYQYHIKLNTIYVKDVEK